MLLVDILLGVSIICSCSFAAVRKDDYMTNTKDRNPAENTEIFWKYKAQLALNNKLTEKINKNRAKNVIFFLGDGMSIPTLAATRVYIGGEEKQLSFETFPHTGLSKTYCVDRQVADSACSATAYLSGIKANYATIGVNGQVQLNDCLAMTNQSNHVNSITTWSQLKGKKTGVVTNTRVTHASPAGNYAHTAQRNWESDANIRNANSDPKVCKDIAHQLVNEEPGRNLRVILGGGAAKFYPEGKLDAFGNPGERLDGVDLVQTWLDQNSDCNAVFAWNRTTLLNLPEGTEKLLGLFATSHMEYNLERNVDLEPSLAEMTEAAINILRNDDDQGFFLFVEGGKIDLAHHENMARISLDETAEFSKAVQTAMDLTDESDTLIVVTSDHAHTMTMAGYASRGHNIFGFTGALDNDGLPFSTLSYANGPGYKYNFADGSRYDLRIDDLNDVKYKFPGMVPLVAETHGGDDVGIFARGPWSHLFTGVMEQNLIPHLMAYASCVGDGVTLCAEGN